MLLPLAALIVFAPLLRLIAPKVSDEAEPARPKKLIMPPLSSIPTPLPIRSETSVVPALFN